MGRVTLRSFALRCQQVSRWLDYLVAGPAIALVALMTISVLVGVFFRYFLRSPLPWSEELSRYAMIWMGLLGVSLAIVRREHVAVEYVVDRFPPIPAMTIRIVVRILMAYYLWLLLKLGYAMAVGATNQVSPAMGLSMYWPLMAVPTSAAFALLQLILTSAFEIILPDARRSPVGQAKISVDAPTPGSSFGS